MKGMRDVSPPPCVILQTAIEAAVEQASAVPPPHPSVVYISGSFPYGGACGLLAGRHSDCAPPTHPHPPTYHLPGGPPPTPPPGLSALQAGQREGGDMHTELAGRLQALVKNYTTKRSALLEEILPEVGADMA